MGVAYVILGFIFNRFVRGAKGNEQFPNYSFWITCGDHISVSKSMHWLPAAAAAAILIN